MTVFFRAATAAFFAVSAITNFASAQEVTDASATVTSATAPDTTEPINYFARDTLRIRTVACPFKGEVQYKDGEISCYQLEVPENREKPDSRMIELQFIKLAARKPEKWDNEEDGDWFKRADPIIYFTGGPGAKALGYVKRFQNHGARDVRDLYILEQRGIGWSSDFCLDYPLFDPSHANTPEWNEYQLAGVKSMEACFAKASAAGVDLSGYNTIENARDARALRMALGYDEWNVWGISYGSILGQAYLKEDPEGIRAAVIDAIVPLRQDATFHNIARYYDRDLTMLQEICEADDECARNFPNFKERLKGAIEKVADSPIIIDDAIDAELFPTGKGYFFHDIIGALPFILFYEQDNYPSLPAMIDALARMVEEEDYGRLRILTAGGPGGGVGFDISQGMYDAISCNDGWHPQMKAAFQEDIADYPALGKIFGSLDVVDKMASVCEKYGANARPATDYLPVETDIRTLIVEGAMDPITPPPLAQDILSGFSNGTYVEFAYAGHGPTRSVECAGDFLTKFYDNPDSELDTSCPEGMEAPEFNGPLFTTDGLIKLATVMSEEPKKIVVPALWAGLPAFVLIFGAIVYTLAPVARLINGAGAMTTGGARVIAWVTALAGAAAIGGIAAGGAVTADANGLLLLFGLPGWTKGFAMAGLAAGPLGLLLLLLTMKARMRMPLPIGVFLGLLLTGLSGIALASWLSVWGFMPF
ncbi:alpha/beta fold hydrolase [Hyphococcus flavus]|uniref:Proline iminopeptidase n=1 Tax=Hyphococcus flavus TaxID=1866326 RepID=A0AAF0CGS3_9PROT|nr:alpha/beta fold hydrolase [Hyphococcus flavus]WDI32563.1 alpha/beta fold hydrolase [Hyphococcus flavus]